MEIPESESVCMRTRAFVRVCSVKVPDCLWALKCPSNVTAHVSFPCSLVLFLVAVIREPADNLLSLCH